MPHSGPQIVLSNWVAEFTKWLPTMPARLPGLSKAKASPCRAAPGMPPAHACCCDSFPLSNLSLTSLSSWRPNLSAPSLLGCKSRSRWWLPR